MRRLKSEGTSIVYVSHRFELYAVCDRVTVLRDGRNIVTQSLPLNRLDLVCHMLGRKPDEVSKGVTAFAGRPQTRQVGQCCCRRKVSNIRTSSTAS